MRYLPPLIILLFSATGLLAQNYLNIAPNLGIQQTYGLGRFGGGLSFADFNQDGWDDLSLASDQNFQIKFYKNVNGQYVEENFGLLFLPNHVKQLIWVDVENDGDKDLLVTADFNPNYIYINDGQFNFTPQQLPRPSGVLSSSTFGASFGDYDRDGDLDLFLCHFIESGGAVTVYANQLLENESGVFMDVSENYFFDSLYQLSFQSAFLDYDYDLNPDIYIANDRQHPNQLYKGDGLGGFTDHSASSAAGIVLDAMCVTAADYDNDMDLDIYITDTDTNVLLQNQANGSFLNVADSIGVAHYITSWGSNFLDYDNDGFLDLYVCSGFYPQRGANKIYQNLQNGQFSEVNIGFLNDSTYSYSSAIGDYNNDGYPEIVVSQMAPDSLMLWSSAAGNNNWVKIRLEGSLSNRDAVGCWLHAYANNQVYTDYTQAGEGYLAQSSQDISFGIAQATQIDSLKINWISGISETYYNLSANKRYWILEGSGICNAGAADASLDNLLHCTGDSSIFLVNGADSLPWPKGLRATNSQGQTYDFKINSPLDFAHFLDTLPHGNYQLLPLAFHHQNAICDISDSSVSITVGSQFSWQSQVEQASLPQGNNASIQINFNGEANVNYTYQWNMDTTLNGLMLSNLSPGSYQLNISDQYGCEQTDSFYIQDLRNLMEDIEHDSIPSLIMGEETINTTTRLALFPNPVKNKLNIKLPKETLSALELYIYSADGQLQAAQFFNNLNPSQILSIDVSSFPQGLYYIFLKGEGFNQTGKFTKND
jgi:hypothetical protein